MMMDNNQASELKVLILMFILMFILVSVFSVIMYDGEALSLLELCESGGS